MVMLKKWGLLVQSVLFFSAVAWAEPKVVATVDSNEIGLGETVTLTITVTSDSTMSIGDHRLPQIDNMELIQQFPTRESRSVYTNGKFEFVQTQRYNYVFQASQKGAVTIPPIEIVVNNKAFKTNSIQISIKDTGAIAQNPSKSPSTNSRPSFEDEEDPMDEAEAIFNQLLKRHGIGGQQPGQMPRGAQPNVNPSEAFFIQMDVDKNEAYVGEQVTASWYIYTRNQIQNIDTLKYPNLKGFLKEDIEVATKLDFQQEVINGIAYRKALLVSYALFPIKEGQALVDAYKARCTVLTGGGSLFNMGNSYTFSKSSQEAKVKVKPIPTLGRPSDYAGGVGQFTIKSSIENSTVPLNQPFTLRIRLEGRGNAKSIDLPTLNLPATLEEYSRRDESKFSRDGTSFKEFEILLIPRQTGKIQIPGFTMSFFDPSSGRFYSGSAIPIELNVVAGKGSSVPNAVNPSSRDVAPERGQKLPPLALGWESHSSSKSKTVFWSVVYLLIFLFLGFRAKVELKIGQKRKSLLVRMNRRFKKVRGLLEAGNWRGVGTEVVNTVYTTLGEIAEESGGSSSEIEKVWEKIAASVRREFEVPLRKELAHFEALSFAPESSLGDLKEKDQMRKHVGDIESVLKKLVQMATKATATKS
jgi:hypothetical protein